MDGKADAHENDSQGYIKYVADYSTTHKYTGLFYLSHNFLSVNPRFN